MTYAPEDLTPQARDYRLIAERCERIAAELARPQGATLNAERPDEGTAPFQWRERFPIPEDDPKHPRNNPEYSERCEHCGAPTKPSDKQECLSCWRLLNA